MVYAVLTPVDPALVAEINGIRVELGLDPFPDDGDPLVAGIFSRLSPEFLSEKAKGQARDWLGRFKETRARLDDLRRDQGGKPGYFDQVSRGINPWGPPKAPVDVPTLKQAELPAEASARADLERAKNVQGMLERVHYDPGYIGTDEDLFDEMSWLLELHDEEANAGVNDFRQAVANGVERRRQRLEGQQERWPTATPAEREGMLTSDPGRTPLLDDATEAAVASPDLPPDAQARADVERAERALWRLEQAKYNMENISHNPQAFNDLDWLLNLAERDDLPANLKPEVQRAAKVMQDRLKVQRRRWKKASREERLEILGKRPGSRAVSWAQTAEDRYTRTR